MRMTSKHGEDQGHRLAASPPPPPLARSPTNKTTDQNVKKQLFTIDALVGGNGPSRNDRSTLSPSWWAPNTATSATPSTPPTIPLTDLKRIQSYYASLYHSQPCEPKSMPSVPLMPDLSLLSYYANLSYHMANHHHLHNYNFPQPPPTQAYSDEHVNSLVNYVNGAYSNLNLNNNNQTSIVPSDHRKKRPLRFDSSSKCSSPPNHHHHHDDDDDGRTSATTETEACDLVVDCNETTRVSDGQGTPNSRHSLSPSSPPGTPGSASSLSPYSGKPHWK